MITLDLTKGFGDHPHYKLFKFPGGEIHFKLKIEIKESVRITTRLNTSDDILALCVVVDTLAKDDLGIGWIEVFIPYFPYQQADRNFGEGECFSLKTITKILNNLEVDKYTIYDPHSDVTPALLKNCEVIDNSQFIKWVMSENKINFWNNSVWLSPDSGAYKKIFKLAEKIGFKGEILCCQKNRDIKTGEVSVVVPTLPAKDILIIDDICVGGRTFVEIAKKVKTPDECKLYLAISHGIFSNGFEDLILRLDHRTFDHIFTTNSRKEYGDVGNFLTVHKII